jgi:flavodoxin
MPLLNFKLKPLEEMDPFGREPNLNMHWFGLTDGDYWLTLGQTTLYEYSNEMMHLWTGRPTRYADYFVVRLIEDLTELFPAIAAPIPPSLYEVASTYDSLHGFEKKVQQWLEQWPDEPTPESQRNDEQYDLLTSWIKTRTLRSSHLKGGPHLSLFRQEKKIALVWKADAVEEGNLRYWTAGNGEMEMDYDTFVAEVEDFRNRFFTAMAAQVQLAIDRDWGAIQLDKMRLVAEQQERKADFDRSLSLLKREPASAGNWKETERLVYDWMKR